MNNEDFVDIQYKSFYSRQEKSNYPDLSICLWTNPDNEFDETKLPQNVTSKDVAQMLNGNLSNEEGDSQIAIILKVSIRNFLRMQQCRMTIS